MSTAIDEAPQGKLHGGYAVHTPTVAERMWRRLGFRYHLGDEPKDTDKMEGWMCTETRMQFGIADRLRLLLTGKLYIRLVQHLPVKCDYAKNRLDWHIEAPGQR
jgi:hypothetical protein